MLFWRLLLGPILIAALIGILVLDAKCGSAAPWLGLLAVLLALRSGWELVDLLRTRAFEPLFWLSAVCSVSIISVNWLPSVMPRSELASFGLPALGPAMLAYAVSVMLVLASGAMRYQSPGKSL